MTSRRGFLGGLLGGVAAGPQAAASVLKQSAVLGTSGYANNGLSNGIATYGKPLSGSYSDNLRSQLVEIATGRSKMKREQMAAMANFIDEAEIAALRSVSPRYRAHMAIERRVERQLRQQENYLQRELRRALERGDA